VGFDIFAAFKYCSDLFVQYGGHRGAGGFSMDASNINAFRQKIDQYAQEISGWRFSDPFMRIDAVLDPAKVDPDKLGQLRRLAPYGQANPDPQFCCRKAHVEMFPDAREDGALGTINAVPFRLAEDRGPRSTLLSTIISSKVVDVVYNLTNSTDGTPLVLVEDVKVD
jgi:single-stranded DNA-specific DHH superfamily exonuclease